MSGRDPQRRGRPGVDQRRAIAELQRGLRADRAAGRQAEMADDDVGAGARHRLGFGLVEDIRRRQQVLGSRAVAIISTSSA